MIGINVTFLTTFFITLLVIMQTMHILLFLNCVCIIFRLVGSNNRQQTWVNVFNRSHFVCTSDVFGIICENFSSFNRSTIVVFFFFCNNLRQEISLAFHFFLNVFPASSIYINIDAHFLMSSIFAWF